MIFLLVALFYLLHQDFWNWNEARPLLFGFLPKGLFYHAIYTLSAAGFMAWLVRRVWPARLEAWAEQGDE